MIIGACIVVAAAVVVVVVVVVDGYLHPSVDGAPEVTGGSDGATDRETPVKRPGEAGWKPVEKRRRDGVEATGVSGLGSRAKPGGSRWRGDRGEATEERRPG